MKKLTHCSGSTSWNGSSQLIVVHGQRQQALIASTDIGLGKSPIQLVIVEMQMPKLCSSCGKCFRQATSQ